MELYEMETADLLKLRQLYGISLRQFSKFTKTQLLYLLNTSCDDSFGSYDDVNGGFLLSKEICDKLGKELAMEDKMYTLYEYVIFDRTEGTISVKGDISIPARTDEATIEGMIALKHVELLALVGAKYSAGEVVILTRPFC